MYQRSEKGKGITMDFKQFVKLIRMRMGFIVSTVILITLATGIYSYYYVEPVYQASAKLVLTKSDEQIQERQNDYNILMANDLLIGTYRDIVKTTRLMEIVAEDPTIGMTAEQLIGKVNVSSPSTQLMSIDVQDQSYDKAALIANAVSRVLVQEIPGIMKMSNLSILNEAPDKANPSPIQPKPTVNMAIGFVVAAMLAVAVVVLREYMDDSIRTEEEIEQIAGLSVVATVPRLKKNQVLPMVRAESNRKAGDRSYVAVEQQ
jgi:capsular polysaccharide biosynthesis protein